jgi:sulfur-oxidizing protein SoxY
VCLVAGPSLPVSYAGSGSPGNTPFINQVARTVTRNSDGPGADRRTFLRAAGSAAALLALAEGMPVAAAEPALEESAEFRAALEKLLNGARPAEGGLRLELPASIDNGEHVPVALAVDSPMTAERNVKAIHLLSTANPRAAVATFRFTPLSGKARVTTSMRLAKTQDVVAVAELSDGTLLMARQRVDVKVGGCGI